MEQQAPSIIIILSLSSPLYTAAQKFSFRQHAKIYASYISRTIVDIERLIGNRAVWMCIIKNNMPVNVFDESVFLQINSMYHQRPIKT